MAHAPDHTRRTGLGFRIGGWLSLLTGLLCAAPGVGLLFWPMFQELPQQDRPYGWLLDRVAPFVGIGLLIFSALFAAVAIALFLGAARTRATSG
jgi:hypothetical protein